MKTLSIIEPLLNGDRGGYYENVRKIARAASKAKYRVRIYTNLRNSSVIENYETYPVFNRHESLIRIDSIKTKRFSFKRNLRIILQNIKFLMIRLTCRNKGFMSNVAGKLLLSRYSKELEYVFNRHINDESDLVLFSTCDAHTLKTIYEFALSKKLASMPVLHLNLPTRPKNMFGSANTISFKRIKRKLERNKLIGTKIRLYVEDIMLKDYFKNYYGLGVRLQEILPPSVGNAASNNSESNINITLLYGVDEKFATKNLPDLINRIRIGNDISRKVTFHIQNNRFVNDQIRNAIGSVAVHDSMMVKIEYYDVDINSYKYHKLLSKTDIMFIPCSKYCDARILRNIAVDAASNSNIILSDKNVFPGILVDGKNGKCSDSHDKYYEKLTEIIENLSEYKDNSKVFADKYMKSHPDDKYFSNMKNSWLEN